MSLKTISIAITVLFISYYYNSALYDFYTNFSTYFPFCQVSTYVDLVNHVLLPKFSTSNTGEKLFTVEELKEYSGENAKYLYLSILGSVFDVSTGTSYYGTGQMYSCFIGRDASRAFITGDFTEEGLRDDVLDLPLQDLKHIKEWLKMYSEKYDYKGKLIGRYYDSNGNPTEYYNLLKERFMKAEETENLKTLEKMKFPPCNVEWIADKGSRVWCSVKSGGVERDWIGVPRKFYVPGANSYRCACVNISNFNNDDTEMSQYLVEYEGCEANSNTCYIKT